MTESDRLLFDLLYKIVESIPAAKPLLGEGVTRGEMTEILRLNSSSVFEAYQDLSMAFESLNFIAADYQLRLKAEDIWRQQHEVFRARIKPCAADLYEKCSAAGIDVGTEIENIVNY